MSYYQYQAKLIKVVDGDTVDLEVDLGFSVLHKMRFRLLYINAPEMKGPERPLGLISKQHLIDLLGSEPLKIITHKDSSDVYGRYLCEIFIHETHSVNAQMVTDGQAIPFMVGE